jgi:hypothetical protein
MITTGILIGAGVVLIGGCAYGVRYFWRMTFRG